MRRFLDKSLWVLPMFAGAAIGFVIAMRRIMIILAR